jgi:xylulose-5-phosphate/fructose-6-phosphate phosphoketolase
LKTLEEWMRSYKPEKLFPGGKLDPELQKLSPEGLQRMSCNPVSNGGSIRKPLDLPDYRDYAMDIGTPGTKLMGSMSNFAGFLRDVMKINDHTFRLFGPDETQSNKLDKVYEGKVLYMNLESVVY